MRHNADYTMPDPAARRRHLRAHPWGVLVSTPPAGLVATHVPVLLEAGPASAPDAISVLSHLGRPDDVRHELGGHDVLLIVEGASGYVSPSWYGGGPAVPTWNFTTVHLHGRPELLSAEENLRALAATVDALEAPLPHPFTLHNVRDYAAGIAAGTAGFRLRATRVEAKAKHSQDKPPEVVDRVLAALEGHGPDAGPYTNPALAQEMRRTREEARHG